MNKTLSRVVQALIIALVTAAITACQLLAPLDNLIKDCLYQLPDDINKKIKIIAIDEKTLSKYGNFGTWSRQTYADLINKLNEHKGLSPSVIAFDISFFGELDSSGDTAFAQAAAKSGNVIAAAQLQYNTRIVTLSNGKQVIDDSFVAGIEYPYDSLKSATAQGFINIAPDDDSTVRRTYPYATYENSTMPSFSNRIYSMYCKNKGINTNEIKTNSNGQVMIKFAGKPGDYEVTSLCDVLDGTADTRNFTDSIVLVGAYAQGMQDSMYVPTGGSEQMYGVEVHANILQAFIDSEFPVQANRTLCAILTAIICAAMFLLLGRLKLAVSTVVGFGFLGAELLAGFLLSKNGIVVDIVYILLMTIIAYFLVVIQNYLIEKLNRKKVLDAFKKYVDPEIVAEISKKSDFSIKLGGEKRHIAVLFVDIRGFTALSECLEPEEVVTVLNKYLYLTTHSILNNGGTLDKFVGDATMAVFNAPFDLDDYIFKAVCAAVDISAGDSEFNEKLEENLSEISVQRLRERWKERSDGGVGFGVGVHCGYAIVGNIGCDFRMDYTAIGDTVNTAARIESGAKKAQVLISEDVYQAVKDRVVIDSVEEKQFKNKAEPVKCYSVSAIRRGLDESDTCTDKN